MTNLDALGQWSGEVGDHWATEAERYHRMNATTADRIVRAAASQPGQRVLDVGCGNGALTRRARLRLERPSRHRRW